MILRLFLPPVMVLLVVFAIIAIRSSGDRTPLSPEKAEAAIAALVNGAVTGKGAAPNAVVQVDAPSVGVRMDFAAGAAHAETRTPMTPDTPFHSASVGKLHTAAAVHAVAAMGRLEYDHRLADILGADLPEGLLVIKGVDRTGEITVEELLAHTSGLPDYYADATMDRSPNLVTLLVDEPDRTWTIDTRLEYAAEKFAPIAAPGRKFHYADTNYDLLGLVIEKVTGKTFDAALHDLVMDPAGLDETRIYPGNPPFTPDTPRIADAHIGGTDVSEFPSVSVAGPGGGLAVTASDLSRFLRSLEAGVPVGREPFVPTGKWGPFAPPWIGYGRGMMRIDTGAVNPFSKGAPVLYGHSGSLGSFAYFVPAFDATITGTFNDDGWGTRKHVTFLIKTVSILNRVSRLPAAE